MTFVAFVGATGDCCLLLVVCGRYNNVNGIEDATGVSYESMRPYMGATCADYASFLEGVVKVKTLANYLQV